MMSVVSLKEEESYPQEDSLIYGPIAYAHRGPWNGQTLMIIESNMDSHIIDNILSK